MLHRKSSDVSSVILTNSDCDGGRVAGAGICEGGLGEREGACISLGGPVVLGERRVTRGTGSCWGERASFFQVRRHLIMLGASKFAGGKVLDLAWSERICG